MSGVTLNVLITATLNGQARNHERLGREAERYARKITNRFCPDFPEDRHGEVFQQAFVELFTFGAGALAGRTGLALFRRSVFNAIRAVRSMYTAPGERTRRPSRKSPPDPRRVAAEDVGQIADAETVERCTMGDGTQAHIDFDMFGSAPAAAAVQLVEDRFDLDKSLLGAPPGVAQALRLICLNGETLQDAAVEVQLSRFALSRKLDAFCPLWRTAA